MARRLNHVEIGSGRPILVLHGGRLDHRHMRDALEPVFDGVPGWRRIYVDLPGCGGSTGFAHVRSQDDVLSEVAAFASAAGAGGRLAVIGESRGSYIAQGLGHAHPHLVSGLALIVPGGNTAAAQGVLPEPVALVPDAALIAGLEPEMRGRAERLVVQTAGIIEKIRQTKLPAAAVHDPALEARVQERFLFSFHDAMNAARFDKPAVIISGRQDSIAGYEDAVAMLGRYSRGTFALLDCAGHSLSWERPELFTALMRDWLERLERP